MEAFEAAGARPWRAVNRPTLLLACLAAACAVALLSAQAKRAATSPAPVAPFTIVEAAIPEMRAAMQQGRVTSKELVRQCLVRIATYEKLLNATIAVNPRVLEEAEARDAERDRKKIRGRLRGIPVALKDNIHMTGMPTTGGALVFAGFVPPYEATLTGSLRQAGAIIIAKTVMSELANWVATGMPGNHSAIGGYGMTPTTRGATRARRRGTAGPYCSSAGRAGHARVETSGDVTPRSGSQSGRL